MRKPKPSTDKERRAWALTLYKQHHGIPKSTPTTANSTAQMPKLRSQTLTHMDPTASTSADDNSNSVLSKNTSTTTKIVTVSHKRLLPTWASAKATVFSSGESSYEDFNEFNQTTDGELVPTAIPATGSPYQPPHLTTSNNPNKQICRNNNT